MGLLRPDGMPVNDPQEALRNMLHDMMSMVPGQLFRDVVRFHSKFGLNPTDNPEHILPEDLLRFRVQFMQEELHEYMDAVGIEWAGDAMDIRRVRMGVDPEKALDALIDLVYVALGTAFLHRFPFNDGWARVQEANMSKVRAVGADDERSHRKHTADVVKPAGWKPPVLKDLLGPVVKSCSCPFAKFVVEYAGGIFCETCGGRITSESHG